MTFMVIGLDPNGLAMLKVPELSLKPGSQGDWGGMDGAVVPPNGGLRTLRMDPLH